MYTTYRCIFVQVITLFALYCALELTKVGRGVLNIENVSSGSNNSLGHVKNKVISPIFPVYRVLVTGAGGFVGFHTCLALKRRGDFVVGLDNVNSYYSTTLKYNRIQILLKEGVTFFQNDVCDDETLRTLVQQFDFTHVIHLAAQAGVRYSLDHPLEYVKNNIECFVRLLESIKHQKASLVYASSSSVYGLNTKVPFEESDVVDRPASLYASSKRSDELIARTYNNLYGLRSIGLRFFTVYGPWGRPDMAYFTFAKSELPWKLVPAFTST
jgi:UDP-glucuronate 4-epimerase